MEWRAAAATLAGLILANLADWLFAGVLFHARYQTYPEVWRAKGANPRALIAAQFLTAPTVVGLIGLIAWSERSSATDCVIAALLVWAITAAPALAANGLFIKLDWRVVASHITGWLAKLLLVALCAAWLLHR